MNEIWKPIEEYPNYMVSNLGNVKSLNYKNTGKEKLMTPVMTNGYRIVNLTKNKKMKMCYIHQLVAKTFLEKPDYAECINHINGIKTDNNVDNLEWCTYKHNTQEAYRLNLIRTIPKKDKKEKVVEVRIKPTTYDWVKKLGEKEGLKVSTMIRTLLEREEFRDEIEKQFDRKKRGK